MKSDINLKTFEAYSSDEEKFQFLKSINFGTVIKEKNGIYYTFIPGLSLSAQGKNIEECYSQLHKMKEDHFRRLIETGTAEDVLFSNPHFFLKGEWARLRLKAVRYIMTGSFIVFVTFFLGWQIDAIFKRAIVSASQVVHNEVVKIKTEFKDSGDVSAEKKKERLDKFKAKLLEIKPYTDALNEVLFSQNRKGN